MTSKREKDKILQSQNVYCSVRVSIISFQLLGSGHMMVTLIAVVEKDKCVTEKLVPCPE